MKILVAGLVILFVEACAADCPTGNEPGKLRFTTEMNAIDFGYQWRYKEIDCCATGYDKLTWYHQAEGYNGNWSEYPFTWGKDESLKLKNSNRTIYMLSVPGEAKGYFKCVAENFTSGLNKSHNVAFGVDASYGRYKMIPYDPPATVCINATTLRFSCFADFGQLSPIESFVSWSQSKGNEPEFAEYPHFTEYAHMNITQNYTLRNADTVRNAELVLYNVTRAADGTILKCRMTSTLHDGEDRTSTTVLKICEKDIFFFNHKFLFWMVPLLAVITIIFCVFMFCCRTKLRAVFPSAYYKMFGGTNPKLDGKNYHALIHCRDYGPDEQLANEIYDDITEISSGYRLCMSKPGEGILQGIGDLADKSATLIIISPREDTDNLQPTDDINHNQDDIDLEVLDDVFLPEPNDPPQGNYNDLPNNGNTNNNRTSTDVFLHQLQSMLADNFKDHQTAVTLIVPTEKHPLLDDLKSYKCIVAGEKISKTRRKCLDKLVMRMPLPFSKTKNLNTNYRNDNANCRQNRTGSGSRPLLGSTDSIDPH